MKLKKWLILSYIFVILSPVITGVMLYQLIIDFNNDVEVTDYISSIEIFQKYEGKLLNPQLYLQIKKNLNLIDNADIKKVEIVLYNKDGIRIYSSGNEIPITLDKEELYSGLYEIKQGYRANVLKKPVFKDEDLVGFFQITQVRSEWVNGVNKRTLYAYGIFFGVLIVIIIIVVRLLNKRMNRPIKLLTEAMSLFAKGEKNTDISYKRNDEIGMLIHHFNRMSNEIESKRNELFEQQREKEFIITAISHDLKTPLTSIRAYAESIGKCNGLSGKEVSEYTSVIISKSDYMKNMLDDLFAYTLLNRDYSLNFVEVDGEEFFYMLFSGYHELCSREKVSLSIEQRVSGIYMVDVKQMARVVDNLVSNAIRHSDGKCIYLGAFSPEQNLPAWIDKESRKELDEWRNEGVIILVKNEGLPIPFEDQEKIFSPFYQRDIARNKGTSCGAGLGLSIVNIILNKHDGKIKVISNERAGTIICCWIRIKTS